MLVFMPDVEQEKGKLISVQKKQARTKVFKKRRLQKMRIISTRDVEVYFPA